MAKRGRPKKTNQEKPISRLKAKKLKKAQDEFYNNIKPEDINPNGKEDFDRVLKGLLDLPPEEWDKTD